jgi:hypothetical protein
MGDGYSGILDVSGTPGDGSTGFLDHLWNNAKLAWAAGTDAEVQLATLGTVHTHLTADEAAAQLARGNGRDGATAAELSAADQLQDQAGGGIGVIKTAGAKTLDDIGDKLSLSTKVIVVAAAVLGAVYVLSVLKPFAPAR